VQDTKTLSFNAQVWLPSESYRWTIDFKRPKEAPLIYEAHIGMAQEEDKSDRRLTEHVTSKTARIREALSVSSFISS